MTVQSKTGCKAPVLTRPGTAFRGMAVHACPEDFRLLAQLSLYHQPALNYTVSRLMHRLTKNSFMASLHLRSTTAPVLVAAVERDDTYPQLAISHVPRPFVRELAGYLREGLGIGQASVMTTRDTAEGLEREWPRVGGGPAKLQADNWVWHQFKTPKALVHTLPAEAKIEYGELAPAGQENPATAFAALVKGDKRLASISLHQLSGQNRYLMGDLLESAIEGEEPALLPLLNNMIERAAQNRHSLSVVMGSRRLCLRTKLLTGHLTNCEATYRKVDLSSGGPA